MAFKQDCSVSSSQRRDIHVTFVAIASAKLANSAAAAAHVLHTDPAKLASSIQRAATALKHSTKPPTSKDIAIGLPVIKTIPSNAGSSSGNVVALAVGISIAGVVLLVGLFIFCRNRNVKSAGSNDLKQPLLDHDHYAAFDVADDPKDRNHQFL